jgi:hypothetical protein
MPDPNCIPKGQHVERDLSEIIGRADPNMRFRPGDERKPRSGEAGLDTFESEAEAAEHARYVEMVRKERELEAKYAERTPLHHWNILQLFRVPQELFKHFERYTNVPYYMWYRVLENARRAVDTAQLVPREQLKKFSRAFTRSEGRDIQRLLEAKYTSGYTELASALPERLVRGADVLEKIYRDFFKTEGFTGIEADEFFRHFPIFRAAGGDWKSYVTKVQTVPKIHRMLEQDFRTGSLLLDEREFNAATIALKVIRGVANEQHLMSTWNDVRRQLMAFDERGLISQDMGKIFLKYMHEARYVPDMLQISLARTIGKVNKALPGLKLSDRDHWDVVSALLNANFYANMAFNTGFVLRNYMQTLQTTYPTLGGKYTAHGIRAALKALRDPDVLRRYENMGVITKDVIPEQVKDVQTMLSAIGPNTAVRGENVKLALERIRDAGFYLFKQSEIFNRITAFEGQRQLVLDAIPALRSGKMTFSQFSKAIKLDMRDVDENGPVHKIMKHFLETGRPEDAATFLGIEFMNASQFVYTRGNVPYFMMSTMGRFFGQYGTWPMWFREYMSGLVFRGSWENRLGALSRWAATNTAMFYGASQVFGIDLGRWVFFSPLGYTGGPMYEIAQQGLAAANVAFSPGEADTVDQIQMARLKQSWKQLVPFPVVATRQLIRTYDAINDADWPTATKQFFGMPPVK